MEMFDEFNNDQAEPTESTSYPNNPKGTKGFGIQDAIQQIPPRQPFRRAQNPAFVREPRGQPLPLLTTDTEVDQCSVQIVAFKRKRRTIPSEPKPTEIRVQTDNVVPYDEQHPQNQNRIQINSLIQKYRANPNLILTIEDRKRLTPVIKPWILKPGFHFDNYRLRGHTVELKRLNRERQQVMDSHQIQPSFAKRTVINPNNIFAELLGNPCQAKWFATYDELLTLKRKEISNLPKEVHRPDIPIRNSKISLYSRMGSHSNLSFPPHDDATISTNEDESDATETDPLTGDAEVSPLQTSGNNDSQTTTHGVIDELLNNKHTPETLLEDKAKFINFKNLVSSNPRATWNRAGAYEALLPRNRMYQGITGQFYIKPLLDDNNANLISINEIAMTKQQEHALHCSTKNTDSSFTAKVKEYNNQISRFMISLGTTTALATGQQLSCTTPEGPYKSWHRDFFTNFTTNLKEYLKVGTYIPGYMPLLNPELMRLSLEKLEQQCEIKDTILIHEHDFPSDFPWMNSFSLLDGQQRNTQLTVEGGYDRNVTFRDLESTLPRPGERFTYSAMEIIIKTLCSYEPTIDNNNTDKVPRVLYYKPELNLEESIQHAEFVKDEEALNRYLNHKSKAVDLLKRNAKFNGILVILSYFPYHWEIPMEVLAVCSRSNRTINYFCPYQPEIPIKEWTPIPGYPVSPHSDPLSLSQQMKKLKKHLDFIHPVQNGWTNALKFTQKTSIDKLKILDLNQDRLVLCKYTDLMNRYFHDTQQFVPWILGPALPPQYSFKGADHEAPNCLSKRKLDTIIVNFRRTTDLTTSEVPQDLMIDMFNVNCHYKWAMPYLAARYYDLFRYKTHSK